MVHQLIENFTRYLDILNASLIKPKFFRFSLISYFEIEFWIFFVLVAACLLSYQALVSQINGQTELSRRKGLAWREHVLKSGLALGLHHLLQIKRGKVLYVVGEVLWVAERAIDGVHYEVGGAVVVKSDEHLDEATSG